MHDLNYCMPDLNYCMPDLNYCGITAELLRNYCGITAELLRNYCGITAELLRNYCGITAELLSNRLNYCMPEKIHRDQYTPHDLKTDPCSDVVHYLAVLLSGLG